MKTYYGGFDNDQVKLIKIVRDLLLLFLAWIAIEVIYNLMFH